MLEALRRQAAARGIELDVGEPVTTNADFTAIDNDPQRLTTLTAHAVARFADRFSLTRRFSRHLEGKERRAGILSDVGAALVCLYQRNPGAVEHLAVNFKEEVQSAHARRVQTKEHGSAATNGAGKANNITTPTGG